jgi:hypothetical protein
MKKQLVFFLVLLTCFTGNIFAQVKIGNNPTTIGTSSVLEIESINKGVVLPRMTGAQMNAITTPVSGMYVYNTDSLCICQYNGTAWRSMCGGNVGSVYNDWHITGNAATVDGTNFLGTTDNIPFNIRVNNQKSGRIDHLNYNAFFGYLSGNSNTGQSNSFFGHQAGYANTTGSFNTFTGDSSGYSNTTGNYNTAYGYQSLRLNTSGNLNTALGYKSLWSMTTGSDNSGVGLKSLLSNTTGNNNVAVGNHASEGNVTGSNNATVGYATLFNNSAGGNNALLGYQVMYNSTSGSNNVGVGAYSLSNNNADNIVAIGTSAGTGNTTGTGNSFLGYQAGSVNTTGSNGLFVGYQAGLNNTVSNNHFVGYQAGYSNTTGNINHFEGYQAGYSNTTGIHNIGMGYQSLYTNSTGGFNTAIGYQTLYLNTTGGSNTAVGWSALNKNTTGTSNTAMGGNALNGNLTGNNNIAVGNNALLVNTAGANNVAVGISTLAANSTGSWNTAVGGSTLNKNTTGNSNTAIGESTLPYNTTGNYNSGLGSQTLYSNTTGSNNTATGYQALYNNLTGSHNLANGYQTLRSNTSGNYNTATGELAMFADTSGSNNTAVGWASLYSNTNGSSNTAIGYGALYPNVIGINKTAVGYQSGFNDSLGGNNTWIGYQADQGVARTTALTNASAIGYLAKANISNSLILGGTGANAVSVGIGTASPNTSSVLDITSTTKGVLPPRVTTTQMNAIPVSAATNGMFVYNTDSSCYCLYNGVAWRSLCAGAINTKSVTEWLDKDSLSGYTGAAMIYAKQALTGSQDTVAVFDDGMWYHADPGITSFPYTRTSRVNNLFNSTKIAAAGTGVGYNFSNFQNHIDPSSSAAGNVTGLNLNTNLPFTTGRTGMTYGLNSQVFLSGSVNHTGTITSTQGIFLEGTGYSGTASTARGANFQIYKGGTGSITTAQASYNIGWIANNAGGTIANLTGSRNEVSYPNSGVINTVTTTANAGDYYVGFGGPASGTGSFGTANGINIGLNLAATSGNAVPVTNVNALNIDFQSQSPDARITNVYGIKINDVTRGGTLNYGIYTGLGKISFGDNTEIRSTGFLTIPNGTTAQRPAAPAAGMIRYNNTLGITEEYNGTGWEQRMISSVTAAAATTGTIAVTMSGMSVYTITPTGACTFNASGGVAGQYCSFVITTTGTTSRTLTWGSNFKTTATLATGTVTAKVFTITFIYDGTNWNETSRTTAM